MDLFNFNMATFFSFLLTFMRVSLVLFLLPFYNTESIPVMVKACLSLVLTLALWPHLSFPGDMLPSHPANILLILLGELVLGLMLGLSVHFIFAAIQTGGEVMGFQMGFTMVSLADPLSGAQVSVTAHFLYMTSLLVFIFMDGHLFLLRGMADSFRLIPPGGIVVGGAVTQDIIALSAGMFSVAVRIAAPVIAALFLVELSLAIMGRAAPQMNLLTFGFPLKIAVGFFFIGMLFNILATRMEEVIQELRPMFTHLMRLAQ